MRDEVRKRADEIATLPKDTSLGGLHLIAGFEEWRKHPVTVELLARLVAKVEMGEKIQVAEFSAVFPFMLSPEGRDKKSWNQGCIDGYGHVIRAAGETS